MAQLEIKTSIIINATPPEIWKVLINFSAYENWNPFIRSVDGDFKVGNKIKINAGGMNFKPEVLVFDENKEIRWIGRLFMKGIFDGEHSFRIIGNNDNTSTFKHEEIFKGLLVGLFRKKLNSETRQGFLSMNAQLKKLVENQCKTA